MSSQDKFEIGTEVVCIKKYEKIKVGTHHRISGSGNLTFVNSDKSGYGFGIDYTEYDFLSRKSTHQFYYFTIDEMSEFFITSDEDFKAKIRDERINQIILK
jgi:hypothetical protein